MAKNWTTNDTASERARERHVTARLRNAPQALTGFGEPNALSAIIRPGALPVTREV
jgi:hypothetical protein